MMQGAQGIACEQRNARVLRLLRGELLISRQGGARMHPLEDCRRREQRRDGQIARQTPWVDDDHGKATRAQPYALKHRHGQAQQLFLAGVQQPLAPAWIPAADDGIVPAWPERQSQIHQHEHRTAGVELIEEGPHVRRQG